MSHMDPTRERIAMLDLRGFAGELADVCRRHRVTADEVCGSRRFAPVVRARHDLWLRMHSAGYSTPAIGRVWGCDPTTIWHGVQMARFRPAGRTEAAG